MWYPSQKNELELVFIYDALMLKEVQEQFKMNLTFVSFGYIEGYKLYHYRKSIVAMPSEKSWGNNKIFGAVYAIKNFQISSIKLDAYYYTSQARLGKVSEHDMRQRLQSVVHLFNLTSQDELISHRYKSHKQVPAQIYIGNIFDNRLIKHINYGRYRIVDGIDKTNYKKLLEERGISCS